MSQNAESLPYGLLTRSCAHLCINMQNRFAERTEWHTPWMTRVLPIVVPLARALRDRTVYTRFIPPANAREVRGSWRRYYERCPSMSREQLDPKMLELVQPLAEIASLGAVVDKRTYSPWLEQTLELRLAEWGTDTRDCFSPVRP
jgi:nicotinamidase-related amidase